MTEPRAFLLPAQIVEQANRQTGRPTHTQTDRHYLHIFSLPFTFTFRFAFTFTFPFAYTLVELELSTLQLSWQPSEMPATAGRRVGRTARAASRDKRIKTPTATTTAAITTTTTARRSCGTKTIKRCSEKWEVMTGETQHTSRLALSSSLLSCLSLSLASLLCLSCSALVLATNLLTDVNFYQRRLSMLPDTCPSHTHTHTQPPVHTHTQTECALLTWNICGVLWSRFAFNYAPGHGHGADGRRTNLTESLVPNGDRDWASCQSPLTLTCMLLDLFNSDCETVPSIALHSIPRSHPPWLCIIRLDRHHQQDLCNRVARPHVLTCGPLLINDVPGIDKCPVSPPPLQASCPYMPLLCLASCRVMFMLSFNSILSRTRLTN